MVDDNLLNEIKKKFYIYRNGVVAQQLRDHHFSYKFNYGLTLPLIKHVASFYSPSVELSLALWNNKLSRESMMLAPCLYPEDKMQFNDACAWIDTIPNVEIADVCSKELFVKMEFASDLILKYSSFNEGDIQKYFSFRLFLALLSKKIKLDYVYLKPAIAAAFAEIASNVSTTKNICVMLLMELCAIEDLQNYILDKAKSEFAAIPNLEALLVNITDEISYYSRKNN